MWKFLVLILVVNVLSNFIACSDNGTSKKVSKERKVIEIVTEEKAVSTSPEFKDNIQQSETNEISEPIAEVAQEPLQEKNSKAQIDSLSKQDGYYYRTPNGKRYHLDPNCGGENSYVTNDISTVTPCAKCAK